MFLSPEKILSTEKVFIDWKRFNRLQTTMLSFLFIAKQDLIDKGLRTYLFAAIFLFSILLILD
jgi:hypothetical protein